MRKRWSLTGSQLSSALARWTQAGFVRAVQRNTIVITAATSNTATITAVDVSNSVIHYLGQTGSAGLSGQQSYARVALTNGTTVTASVTTSPGASSVTVSFEVIEFYPGVIKSVQRTTITEPTTTATINPVNTAKSLVDFLGNTTGSGGAISSQQNAYLVLTNSTTVTATTTNDAQVIGVQVVEFF